VEKVQSAQLRLEEELRKKTEQYEEARRVRSIS
jgi:hypothetical protein